MQVVVNIRILIQSHFWNWFLAGGIATSLLFFLFFTMVYHGITVAPSVANLFYEQAITTPPEPTMPMSVDLYWIIFFLLKSPAIWLTTIVALVLCLLPYTLVQVFKNCALAERKIFSNSKVEFDNDGFEDGESIVNIRL